MRITPLLLLVVPVLSTLTGGALALRCRHSMIVLVALGSGLLLGAAFLDLLPEAIALGSANGAAAGTVLFVTLASFLVFLSIQSALDQFAEHDPATTKPHRAIGRIGGLMLIFHSFRDGMAIGLSYTASHVAGYAVAIGIAAHDIGDGMNTVILTTGGQPANAADYAFLVADSIAPFAGGLLTMWWAFSFRNSALLLAVASGFFIHMATSTFLPEVRRSAGTKKYLLPAVFFGVAAIYFANMLIGELH